ncbi:hypothetical protein MHK_004403 [Candidatus Magnetomorum sp. HK-1]|nr:hypothetical protein MHK_004403 [Candidatus Magnetomorum sp. HK-1]
MKQFYQITLFFIILHVISCTMIIPPPVKIKDGESYGVLNRKYMSQWYDNYDVGMDYARGGFWDDAKEYFFKALERRKKDKRMSKTYGTNVIHYFPNREIGIIHYFQGNLLDSIKYLEKSIENQTSPRGVFYLNCARRAFCRQKNKDHQAPSIKATFPDTIETYLTNNYQLSISGKITDDEYVQSVYINGEQKPVTLFAPEIQLNEILSLISGENIVHITATDAVGNIASVKRKILLDIAGPIISIDKSTNNDNLPVIQGRIMDKSGIKKVDILIDDEVKAYDIQANHQIVTLKYQMPHLDTFSSAIVRAEDKAGNISTFTLMDNNRPQSSFQPVRLAYIGFLSNIFSQKKNKPKIEIIGYDEIKNLATKKMTIKVAITHSSTIESVSIMVNEKLADIQDQYIELESNSLNRSVKLELDEGENQVEIIVTPKDGEDITLLKNFYVDKEIRNQWKMNVALMPSSTSTYKEKVKNSLRTSLSNRFFINTDFKTIKEYKNSLTKACLDDYISCKEKNQEQAPLWVAEFDFGKIHESPKPVKLFQSDNFEFNPVEIAKDFIRIIKGNEPRGLTIYKLEGSLKLYYLKNDKLVSLIKDNEISYYYESLNNDKKFLTEHVCQYLSHMLMKRLPIVESDISDIDPERRSIYPDLNPVPYNICPGMRMIVFNPTFPRGKKKKVDIAEVEVHSNDKDNFEAILCNPALMNLLKISHRVIVR